MREGRQPVTKARHPPPQPSLAVLTTYSISAAGLGPTQATGTNSPCPPGVPPAFGDKQGISQRRPVQGAWQAWHIPSALLLAWRRPCLTCFRRHCSCCLARPALPGLG